MDIVPESLPEHLKPLLEPTPSGAAKLLAAWDGLTVETQINILAGLSKAQHPPYLARKIRLKALESETAYIRYLAFQGGHFSDDAGDIEVKTRIEADPDALVRYSTKENTDWTWSDRELENPEIFLALPHEVRLAKVRYLARFGEEIANIVTHALDNHLKDGRVSEIELYEVLADYVLKPDFRQHLQGTKWRERYDGYGEYRAGKEIEALWRLVPKSPVLLAHFLIQTLPPEAGLSSGIPKDVIESLTEQQLGTLLYRRDIDLHDLRKELFRTTGKDRYRVKAAAISSHFSIDDTEFAEILSLPDPEKIKTLKEVGPAKRGLAVSIIAWIVLGLIAGFIAAKIVNKKGAGFFLNIVLGIVGAVVGGEIFTALGESRVTGFNLYSLVVSVIGAIIVLVIYHAIAGRRVL